MTQKICDCVLSQNGLGMSGRECNCGNDENAALDRAAINEIERLRDVLRTIADGKRDADQSYATLFAEVVREARAALLKGANDDR